MIVREKNPVNLEMPFGSVGSFITPVDRFYVRCHFPIPEISESSWRLKIAGDIRQELELTMEDLRGMESRTITSFMECAGNGRTYLEPQRGGAQWESGAVGNAVWTGVPLAALLERAGLKASACDIILEGADEGEIKEPPKPAGKFRYARSLPVSKAMDDVVLAYAMNHAPLTPAHGFPLRAIVPGWYGMAAVKWITTITVSPTPWSGYFQTIDYAYWEQGPGGPALIPITTARIKSQMARPEFAETVPAGRPYRIHGAAWTSAAEVVRVEISTDGGKTWEDACLTGESLRNAWRLWDYHWNVPAQAGRTIVMSRATDSTGRIQPASHHDDRGNYLIHHCLPIEVTIH